MDRVALLIQAHGAVHLVGFVLAGIPVYYITNRNEGTPAPRVIGTYLLPSSQYGTKQHLPIEFFASLWARARGRPPAGAGWEAVATDGDEQVEMLEGRRTSLR